MKSTEIGAEPLSFGYMCKKQSVWGAMVPMALYGTEMRGMRSTEFECSWH